MRKLYHPKVEEITVEGILYALSDPIRAQIFMKLAAAEKAQTCCTFINISDLPLPKSTLSQHFRVLREAGLVYSERKGVEMHNNTRCAELREKFGDMVSAIAKAYDVQKSA